MSSAAKNVTPITLELGGKSAMIVFEDADIEATLEWILMGIFFNQGQVCSATSRLLVHESIAPALLERLVEEAQRLVVGDPLTTADAKLGPLVSKPQFERVRGYIKSGIEEGATLLCGGLEPPAGTHPSGFFVSPTIFADVTDDMTIWKEEIFGPVLCVRTFKTESEAVAAANNSPYGLAAAVISKDLERCERVVRALEVGICWVNCSQPTYVELPWGGVKKSGIGRELGPWGLDNYLNIKQITRYAAYGNTPFGWYDTRKA
jgi:betaine-aldehyde dehydrogenase